MFIGLMAVMAVSTKSEGNFNAGGYRIVRPPPTLKYMMQGHTVNVTKNYLEKDRK